MFPFNRNCRYMSIFAVEARRAPPRVHWTKDNTQGDHDMNLENGKYEKGTQRKKRKRKKKKRGTVSIVAVVMIADEVYWGYHMRHRPNKVIIAAVVAIKCYCKPGYMVLGLKKTKALLLTATSISILSTLAITFYILVTADH